MEVPGGWIVGRQAREGTPVLLLHGGPLSDYTAPLADLLPQFRTIRYQQRGLPPSTVAPPYTIEAHLSDAIAVLDALQVERVWAVGHSWGGHLALHLAVACAERLLGVIAIDPLGAVPDGGASELDRNIFERLARHSAELSARAADLDRRAQAGAASDAEMHESVVLAWPYYFARPDQAPPPPQFDVSVELYAGVFASIFEHFELGTLERGLPHYEGRFMIIHGEDDPLPIEASRKTAKLVPQTRFVPITDTGHFPWLERPNEFSAALTAFLNE